jgi:hypothetical protein
MGGLYGEIPKSGCLLSLQLTLLSAKGNPLERRADHVSFRGMEVLP